MRTIILSFAVFALFGTPARGDINSDIQSLFESYRKIKEAIENTPETERPKLYDNLREQVHTMAFNFGYLPDGSDTMKTEKSDEILLESVYGAFIADQGHLERAIIHTQDRVRAIAIMPDRAKSLIGLFPICRSASGSEVDAFTPAVHERIQLVQYLAKAYEFIPDSLVESVRPQMSRWQGENRIPGLLVLAESGDTDAKAELEHLASKSARALKSIFRGSIDYEKKWQERKRSSQKSLEPKSSQ